MDNAINPVVCRYNGFLTALQEYGISPYCEPIDYYDPSNDFKKRLVDMLNIDSGLDALFVINDVLASDIIKDCIRLGIRIPQDLAIIGFDDLPLCTTLPVQLSTIRQNFFGQGYYAAEMAYSSSSKDQNGIVRQLYTNVELVPRASTAINRYGSDR